MSSTFWFDFFKYLFPILAGGLGVLGILNVFKTPHNRLSFWGVAGYFTYHPFNNCRFFYIKKGE